MVSLGGELSPGSADEQAQRDAHFMGEALRLARKAAQKGEVPIGALIVHQGRVIGRAWNQVEMLRDATAHAEMLALTQAQAAIADWRLSDCDLYVTKEPCPMCAGAIVHCRIRRLIFGCGDPKGGAAGGFWNLLQAPNLNHRCEIKPEVRAAESVELLKDFFAQARARRTQGQPHDKGQPKTLDLDGLGDLGSPGKLGSTGSFAANSGPKPLGKALPLFGQSDEQGPDLGDLTHPGDDEGPDAFDSDGDGDGE